MEVSILKINCKRHGKQMAVALIGGEIWCKKCQEEFLKEKNQ